MLVFGPRSHPVSPCPPIPCRPVNGRIKLLMQLKGTESDGCNRSTWFTTIAMTLNVSLKVSQPNASDQGSSREAKLAYIFNCWFPCINMNSLFFVQKYVVSKINLFFFFFWKENQSVVTNSKAKLRFDSEDVKREMKKEIEKHMAQHVVPWEVLIASSKVTFDYWT